MRRWVGAALGGYNQGRATKRISIFVHVIFISSKFSHLLFNCLYFSIYSSASGNTADAFSIYEILIAHLILQLLSYLFSHLLSVVTTPLFQCSLAHFLADFRPHCFPHLFPQVLPNFFAHVSHLFAHPVRIFSTIPIGYYAVSLPCHSDLHLPGLLATRVVGSLCLSGVTALGSGCFVGRLCLQVSCVFFLLCFSQPPLRLWPGEWQRILCPSMLWPILPQLLHFLWRPSELF